MIYCITTNGEREELSRTDFAMAGILHQVRFFPGFIGKEMGLRSILQHGRNWVEPETYVPGPGQIGCLLSHQAIWRSLSCDLLSHESALVFEDDAIIPGNFLDTYLPLRRSWEGKYDFAYLGWVDHPAGPLGTHAYWMTRQAIPALLEATSEVRAGVDVLLLRALHHLRWTAVTPSLISQRSQLGKVPSLTRQEPFDFDRAFEKCTSSGWLTKDEGRLLVKTAQSCDGLLVEVGSHEGRSATLLGQLGRVLMCIDPWDDLFLKERDGDERMRRFLANTAGLPVIAVRSKVEAWSPMPAGMVYLDGDHTEEGTERQIIQALRCNPKFIAIHDISDSEGGKLVKRAALRLLGPWNELVGLLAVWELK